MEYSTVKLIHVLGAILFLGNIIVSAVWKIQADRTNDPVVIAFACRLINITDLAFTTLGSALIVIGGIGLFYATGIPKCRQATRSAAGYGTWWAGSRFCSLWVPFTS